jgi:hypothetical protein
VHPGRAQLSTIDVIGTRGLIFWQKAKDLNRFSLLSGRARHCERTWGQPIVLVARDYPCVE